MTTADLFLKISVTDRHVLIRDRTGKPVLSCVAENGFKALKKMGDFIDTVITERKKS